VSLFEGEPPSPVLAAARAVDGEAPSVVDAAVAERLVRSGQAFFAPRVASEDGTVRSLLCAPLWFTGGGPATEHIAGCVALEAAADPSPFQEEHLRLVTAVANLAASRLESLRLREETADMRRMEEDLRGAARIQASLLP
jgi:GAF domain-containing protein